MFKRLHDLKRETVTLIFEGEQIEASEGDSVAAALLAAGIEDFRRSPVSGAARGPRSAPTPGMVVRRQEGLPVLEVGHDE